VVVAKEIARSLGISVRTVEGHLAAMRRVTGAKNTAELTAWGVTIYFEGSVVGGNG
jgi:DNA-binding CsgD family transcriptional regulator